MSIEIGNIVEGKVTRITDFGAFVELEDRKSGLIHISEVADVYVRNVRDFLSEGDTVRAKVISIDDRGKIALSIKQLQRDNNSDRNGGGGARAPRQTGGGGFRGRGQGEARKPQRQLSASFEERLSKFMKESDEKLADWKRKTDSKRGGRGSRRSD
ncbi:MAG: S1 RNA-binding domain-containing protein [Selenomonadaceae bacterium]|nr:S1 RNA-binding domain-containing protein [Selenomonadaceae bacterium]